MIKSISINSEVEQRLFDNKIQNYITRYAIRKRPIDVSFRELVQEIQNSDRATHLIHTYPAKLLMHIPYFFLNNSTFSKPGDLVLDPFCGTGTVLLEAILSGRNAIGADANPLARLITEVKTANYDVEILNIYAKDLKARIRKSTPTKAPKVVNINYWFLPHIQKQLTSILESIKEIEEEKYRKFFLVCFSNCIKKVSLADPRVSVPVKLKATQYHKKHPLRKETEVKLEELNTINVKAKFLDIVSNNIRKVENFNFLKKDEVFANVISSDARNLNYEFENIKTKSTLKNNTVNLIISSPPYAGAQKYIRSSSLNIGWLGLCPEDGLKKLDELNIGRESYRKKDYAILITTGIKSADRLLKKIHKINPLRAYIAANYLNEMRSAFTESIRVLKPDGHLILVAANNQICGEEFKTQEYLKIMIEELGLKVVLRLIDDIKSYGLMTKRNKTASIITREWILVFKK